MEGKTLCAVEGRECSGREFESDASDSFKRDSESQARAAPV